MAFPNDLKYTKDHEWARIEGNQATVGITDHAQTQLGDIVFVELPEVGTEYKAGEKYGVVESIKAVSDLYAPVTGKISEVNATLNDNPSTINQEPHASGWIVKMEITDAGSAESLLNADAYGKMVSEA